MRNFGLFFERAQDKRFALGKNFLVSTPATRKLINLCSCLLTTRREVSSERRSLPSSVIIEKSPRDGSNDAKCERSPRERHVEKITIRIASDANLIFRLSLAGC